MSDFLTNLAARALGAPTLRPRLRSRFEPATAADGIAFEPASPRLMSARAANVDAAQEPPRRKNVDAAPHLQPASHQRHPSLVPIDTKQSDENHHTDPQAAADTAVHPPQPAAPHPRRAFAAAATTTSSPRSTPPPSRLLTESHTETITEAREIIVRELASLAATPTTPAPAAPPRHRYDEQPPRLERTIVTREIQFASAPPRPAPVVSQSRTEVPAPAEPTIHVSIGRVEVRAVTPPPSAKQNRASRAMTIDDYAARRNAKGRR